MLYGVATPLPENNKSSAGILPAGAGATRPPHPKLAIKPGASKSAPASTTKAASGKPSASAPTAAEA